MTSRLVVNSIRHTGASADAITMDASGNVTFPANATCSGTATGFGKVLQSVTATTTTQVETTSTTYADTGLTASITISASSKVLVLVSQDYEIKRIAQNRLLPKDWKELNSDEINNKLNENKTPLEVYDIISRSYIFSMPERLPTKIHDFENLQNLS